MTQIVPPTIEPKIEIVVIKEAIRMSFLRDSRQTLSNDDAV